MNKGFKKYIRIFACSAGQKCINSNLMLIVNETQRRPHPPHHKCLLGHWWTSFELLLALHRNYNKLISKFPKLLSLEITRSQLLPPGFSSQANNAPRPEARFNPLRPRGEKQEQDRKGKSSCEEALSALRHPEMAGWV